MTVEERIQENGKNAKIKVSANGFTKAMPNAFDSDGVLDVDDVLHIPNPIGTVYQRTFGVKSDGTPSYGEFIVVNVSHPGKPDRAIDFYPSSLTKNIWPAEKNAMGEVETITDNGPLNPLGSAVETYLGFQGKGTEGVTDTQLGMNALAGKDIRIAAKTPYHVQAWKNGEPVNSLRKTSQLTYELV